MADPQSLIDAATRAGLSPEMDEPASNDILAELYDRKHRQIIVVFPLMWKHEPDGDWTVMGQLEAPIEPSQRSPPPQSEPSTL